MDDVTIISSPSTTWEWRHVMVDPAPKAHGDSASGASRRLPVGGRDPRRPLTCLLKWRGGPEGWVEIRTRGRVFRVRGDISIADVVIRINEGDT